jgi:hypothetical protein
MNTLENLKNLKLKRKNFILTTGLFAAGVFALSKIPFGLFRKKTDDIPSADVKPEVRVNPDAVKRNTGE